MSDRQFTVLSWWTSDKYKDYDGIIADGSIRSGKTVSMGFSYVLWAMENFTGQDFIMAGKTISTLRRNVINTLKKQINQRPGWSAEEKRADHLMIVRHKGKENTFYFFGGDNESSQDKVQGLTAAGAFFDEVALMPESFVNQATGRCSVDGSKFWFNCNPAGPMHWFKQKWINMAWAKNLLYLHFTMVDNFSLSEKIRKRYESMYSGVFYQRYINGLWVAAEGLIYDMFNAAKHIFTDAIETVGSYFVSCDFGIQNATVFQLWRKEKNGDRWLMLDELRYSGRENRKQKTVAQLVSDLKDWLHGIMPEKIIVDPSATALIAELRQAGYEVKKALNDVLEGISDVATALQMGLIGIAKRCKACIEEFGVYSWDEKKADRGEDAPIKEHDHSMDALRYFVKTMRLIKNFNDDQEMKQARLINNIYLRR
ncbi:MAG: PBSX family phage terminase large subunit [Dorea sp.]|nr:PBSX family phage terminase large subunit [Dorea sp.]